MAKESGSVLQGRPSPKHQGGDVSRTIEFDLPHPALSLEWCDDALVYGHSLGATILTTEGTESSGGFPNRFRSSFQHTGLPALQVRLQGEYLVIAHPDFSISLISLRTREVSKLDGRRGHSSFINSLDVSLDGTIASTGDDQTLIIWENKAPRSFLLAASGKVVKFWSSTNSDRVIVLESNNRIRVLDWKRGEWLLTIYPGESESATLDIGVFENEIVAVGAGWWKVYSMQSLNGGCGYTPPVDEGRLLGCANSPLAALARSSLKAGYVSATSAGIYDLANGGEHSVDSADFDPSTAIASALAVHSQGGSIAFASRDLLTVHAFK